MIFLSIHKFGFVCVCVQECGDREVCIPTIILINVLSGKNYIQKHTWLLTWYLFCLPRNKASADDKAEISSWIYSTDSACI